MVDPYMQFSVCKERLESEYQKYGTLYIAFDFDNTVFDFHKKGFKFPIVEGVLKEAKKTGLKLILFTCEDDEEKLQIKYDYCKERGYAPDYINESPVMNTKKPYYNLLLDDRAGLGGSVLLLHNIITKIKEIKNANN